MKRILIIFLLAVLLLIFGGCNSETKPLDESFSITDIRNNHFDITKNARVVSCYGSFADMWLLSGGKLAGVTKDAVEEHKLELDDTVQVVGTVKEINLEKLVRLNPNYVILSDEITAHHNLESSLKAMNIPYGFFRVDSFEDYQSVMKQFCDINQRPDLYQKNVLDIKENIDNTLKTLSEGQDASFLVMRSFSTGIKVKNDNFVVDMLNELGAKDICDKSPSLLKDFSLEQIILDDPDFIFVLTMGDEKAALSYLETTMKQNPAWSNLSAVKNNRLIVLPKELFHYKPNNRWDESYEFLAKILYN